MFSSTEATILIVLLLPVYVVFMSMAAYLGKVWAIRLLFRRSKSNGEENQD